MRAQPQAHDSGLAALLALPVVPARRFAAWESGLHRIEPQEKTSEDVCDAVLTDAERRFLSAIVADPGKPSSKYTRMARIGPANAAVIRKSLVERGFLREHSVATGRRGRSAIVLEPLEPAKRAVSAGGKVAQDA